MNLSIEVPDRIVQAVCLQYGYKSKVKDENGKETDNPETDCDFCVKIVKSFLKEVTVAVEGEAAARDARKAAIEKATKEVII